MEDLKMKTKQLTLFTMAIFMVGFMTEAQTLKLDTQKSSIEWTGKKVSGSHNGKISFASGSIVQTGKTFSAGEFVVDMKSITVDDITDAGTNANLVGHLKSDDFFGVEAFPTAKLVIKSGTAKGPINTNLMEI
jgi:polyisoprenoid-binding protein YceI